MKVIRNYLYNVSYNILNLILPLITGPYVSRKLGVTGVGINSYTNSIVTWFVLFGSIGIAFYGNREIAYVRNNKKLLTKTFIELQILKTITIVISYIVFLILIFFSKNYKYYLMLQSIYIIAALFDISWLYMGVENFKVTVVRNSLIKILSVILILLFIKDRKDLGLYILLLALSTFFGNLTLWPSLKKELVKINIQTINPFRHFKGSISLFIPLAAVQLYVGLNKTMLGFLDNPDASGFYDKTDSLIKVMLTLITSLSTVLLPYTAKSVAAGKIKEVKIVLYKSFDFASFIAFPMAFGIASISIKFGSFFYGKGFTVVGYALLLEAIIIIFMSWSSITGNQYLVPTNQVSPYTKSILVGAGVNVILNIPLILTYGVYGGIISTVIAEFSVALYQILYIKPQIEIKRMFKNVPKYLFSSLIMFIVVFSINIKFNMDFYTLIFEIIIGILIYILMIFITKPTILQYLNGSIISLYNKLRGRCF